MSLPLKEFELLSLLLDNAGRVLTRDTLIDRVWGHDYVGDTKTLDVHIKRLRTKVEDDPAQPSSNRDDPRTRVQVRGAHRLNGPSRPTPNLTGVTLPGPRRTPKGRPLPSGQAAFTASAFTRLARTHALSTASDAMVATALAGTIFFEGATSDARGKVFLYLLLTMAPFAVVSPLIGPALDRARSGRRWMIIGSAVLRGLLCFFMIRDVDNLLFYPEAFAVLVLQKSYAVARAAARAQHGAATTPSWWRPTRSCRSSPGSWGSSAWPRPRCSSSCSGRRGRSAWPPFVHGHRDRRACGCRPSRSPPARPRRPSGPSCGARACCWPRRPWASSAASWASSRCCSPSTSAQNGVPKWHFGVVAGVSVLGALTGSALAPRIRKVLSEEQMLIGFLLAILVSGLAAIVLGDLPGACLLGGGGGHRVDGREDGVRLDRAARRPGRQPGPVLRQVRDPLPDHLGDRRPARAHRVLAPGRLPDRQPRRPGSPPSPTASARWRGATAAARSAPAPPRRRW